MRNMLLFDLLWYVPEQHYSSQQGKSNSTQMWLLFIQSCHGKFVQRQPGENPSAPAWHCQTSSIITDPNSDPISSSIIPSPPVSSPHITFVLTEHLIFKHSYIQINQTRTDMTRRHAHVNFTYCIFFRGDLQYIKHNSIKTLLQVWRTFITERFWAAALLEDKHTHTQLHYKNY